MESRNDDDTSDKQQCHQPGPDNYAASKTVHGRGRLLHGASDLFEFAESTERNTLPANGNADRNNSQFSSPTVH